MIELKFRLQLFAEGGDGSSAGGDGATMGDANNNISAPTRQKKGEYANVKFGKQPEAEPLTSGAEEVATEKQESTPDPDAKLKAFQDMVKGEYKDIYTQETQKIINKRFKETKNLESQVAQQNEVLDMIYQKYNISDRDLAKLQEAINNDDTYWEQGADEAGLTIEQFKHLKKLEKENAQFLKEQQERQTQANVNAQLQRWQEEADAVKAKFPSFNLEAEVQNENFQRMLRSGVPMEHAYKVAHFDELMNDSVRTTAAETEKAVVNNIRAKGNRPSENAAMQQSAFTVKSDVSKLTAKDRAEIARRVARGERIEF